MKRLQTQCYPFLFCVVIFLQFSLAVGSTPRIQTHNGFSEFERGIVKNVSILSEGKLTLAPKSVRLLDTGDPFIWSVVADKKGNFFLGTGNDGRVYRVTSFGDSSLFFDAQELEVYALALDKQDNLYAGTSPNGKVYKITPSGKATVFFEPNETYVWALVFDSKSNLYVATGEKAKIYQVKPDGTSTILFESDQAHIRCLAFDAKDQLFAGSSGNGYVYKLLPEPKAFVLYDTQMEEVHSLAISSEGEVFAAAYGEPGRMPAPGASRSSDKPFSASNEEQQAKQTSSGEVTLSPQSIVPQNIMLPTRTRTSLFRIDKNGYAKDLWDVNDESIQIIILDQSGNIIIGTGERGKLYQMNRAGETSLILKADEPQITALNTAGSHGLIMGTSNMARCYRIGAEASNSGSFESETIDTGAHTSWGVLSWECETNGCKVSLYTRAGNTERPELTWSSWTKVQEGEVLRISSPTARFLQWKCEFQGMGKTSPVLDKVSITYIQKNLPPEITAVIIHKPGEYYEIKESSDSGTNPGSGKSGLLFPQPLTKSENKKGFRSVEWLFQDPNIDGLTFDVFYSNLDDKLWKPLTKDWEGSGYSWDSAQMADGKYQIKVSASDAPSNPEKLALAAEKLSDPFIIDNTAPEIIDISPGRNGQQRVIGFRVSDKWNLISNVQYSIDAGGWQMIYPIDGICDSEKERFEITIPTDHTGPLCLAIKAMDSANNVGTVQEMFKGSE